LAFALRWRAMIICAVLVALAVLGSTLAPMTIAGFYTDPILLEFALGIAIGVCFTRRAALPRGVAYALIVLGMGLFVVLGPLETDANRLVCWGVPMALLVLGSVNAPTILPGRAFRVLGDASYSIYLTQFCTIAPAAAVVNSVFHGAAGKVLATVALIAVAVGGGVVAYGLVERPLTRVVKGALSRDR
jgi:exopolysaccharide production protein ExoZ